MPSSTINKSLPFALSIGEPAGIGPEIILKSWAGKSRHDLPPFFVIGRLETLAKTMRALGLDIPLQSICETAETKDVFPKALPVLCLEHEADFNFGRASPQTASMVLKSIETAVKLILEGQAAGLVTAPIQKSVLYEAGFTCPGHTEYLAELCNSNTPPVMMLLSDELRVVPLTIHRAISEVPGAITADLIEQTCRTLHTALKQDFGLKNPRIAVAGLNPHAGEDGSMGQEEQLVITPALDRLRRQGMDIRGPLPADTMFHAAARTSYDAALCMYHDQALLPLKTLDFDGGVNVTLGLPIVRTSPDHGTALDIAGKNLASPNSMINALKQAEKIHLNRTKSHV
ncbi:4-hydroxythreonine-4-phosphate dehydrogenase [hydrothermal vent metagenome]|uniref:4-hydroxythreonine-4-phosphate dehydrogenase n=1 Tax=hydrothermal vent metagenome TaxID=652676 RepID=A0A3B0R2D9_9ZZZZ